jgi:rubredoxin
MPRCPNCDFHSQTINDFAYSNDPYSEEEGHDMYPHTGNEVETYLVCPDCSVVIG